MTTNGASSAPRPKRLLTASGKLLDTSNSAAPTLSAHKHAIEAKRASDDAAKRQASTSLSVVSDAPNATSAHSSPPATEAITDPQAISSDSDAESQQPRECFKFQCAQPIDVDLQQIGRNRAST
jgi:hypothetical protein